ncbi:galactitol-1-phosphate 5-dehydrogenase [Candidatus Saganbacteria bacterium]|nr:galactitol-1-phosphate 5-dehydrogenase [Candidatus Saganbacteria bacterium]
MKAIVLKKNGLLALENAADPRPGNNECLVKIRASGICSSDINRAFYGGAYKTPLIMGHEIAGEVSVAAVEGKMFGRGDRVAVYPLLPCHHCDYCRTGDYQLCVKYDYFGSRRDGGFAEFLAVPEKNLVPIPDGVSYDVAALVEPAAVALHGVRQLNIKDNADAIVLGAGPIGNLAGQWLKLGGCRKVYIVDRHDDKLKVAEQNGLLPVKIKPGDMPDFLVKISGGGFLYVVEATGAPALIELAIKIVRRKGELLLLGNISGELKLSQSLVSSVLRREIGIRGTWNSRIDEWPEALNAFKDKLQVKNLIGKKAPLSDGVKVLSLLKDSKAGLSGESYLKVMLET